MISPKCENRLRVHGARRESCPTNLIFRQFIAGIAAECGIEPICEGSAGVVTSILAGEYGEVLCAVESECKDAYIVMPFDSEDILTDRKYTSGERVELKPYECVFAKRR